METFSASEPRTAHWVDNGQHYRWLVSAQPFTARVRWRDTARVATREEMVKREGQPGWTLAETARWVQHLELFGAGTYPSGAPAR